MAKDCDAGRTVFDATCQNDACDGDGEFYDYGGGHITCGLCGCAARSDQLALYERYENAGKAMRHHAGGQR